MKAAVSARSGAALLTDGNSLLCLRRRSGGIPLEATPADIRMLLESGSDLRFLKDSDPDEVAAAIEARREEEIAFQLALAALDSEYDRDFRKETLALLNGTAQGDNVQRHLRCVFFSTPVPEEADLSTAIDLAEEAAAEFAYAFFSELEMRRTRIVNVHSAYKHAVSSDRKLAAVEPEIRHAAVRLGLFYDLTALYGDNAALPQFLSIALGKAAGLGYPRLEEVLPSWVAHCQANDREGGVVADNCYAADAMKEVGERFRVTQERLRQIQEKAKRQGKGQGQSAAAEETASE